MSDTGEMDGVRVTYTSGALDSTLDERFEQSLRQLREATPAPVSHMIAGEHVAEGPVFERRDPSRTAAVASRAHEATPDLVALAVRQARSARDTWRNTSFRERCSRLRAVAGAIADRHLEIAASVSVETGKIRSESIAEVQEAIDLIETYCSQIEGAEGFSAPLASLAFGERNCDTLRPYGVFGVIAPFNFPLALAVNMLSAALLAGNTVVVKPSEAAPWTASALGEAMQAAELPTGAFNLVHGGSDTGRALVGERVDGIAFTGSAQVGREISARLAQGPYPRPVLAEMGGKNPAIVTAQADLEKAAEGIARAAFGLSGQKCSSCSRAIVLEEVHDELRGRLASLAGTFPVGDPSDARAALGPVVDEQAVARFRQAVELAERDGRVLAGGATIQGGNFVAPTVVSDLPQGHELTRRELFLPFVTITPVATLGAAIEEANAVDYGLTAGIFSEDEHEVERFLDEIEAGVVYVNRRAGATTGAWPGVQSFCGWKSSGLTGKGGLGPYYVQQFMREQSRTIMS